MGSGYSTAPPVPPPSKQQEEEEEQQIEVESSDDEEDELKTIFERLNAVAERLERIEAKQQPTPMSAVSPSGSLPVKQMSRFQVCMKEIRNNPWRSEDPEDRPFETL